MRRLALIVLTVLAGGCALMTKVPGVGGYAANNDIKRVTLRTTDDANDDVATAIYLVYVFDKALIAILPEKVDGWLDDEDAARTAEASSGRASVRA